MRITVVILFILIIFITNNVFAICGHANKKNALFFANGMFNEKADAFANLITTKRQLKKIYPDLNYQVTDVAYNTDEFFVFQLNQVFRQKMSSYDIGFWTNLGELFKQKDPFVIKAIQKLLRDAEVRKDKDLRIQIAKYKKRLKENFNITTVAHSQGNFYTNFAFEDINLEKLNMVSVATPDNRVYKDGPYYTFVSDRVVSYLPQALKPNYKKNNPGYFDHKYVDDYLNDSKVGSLILESIYDYYDHSEDTVFSENSSYFNANMKPLLSWYNSNIIKKRKLAKSDCLIVQSIFDLHAAFAISCEERNKEAVKVALEDCHKDFLDKTRRETRCPFYGTLFNPLETYWIMPESADHYEVNPICKMDYDSFTEAGPEHVIEALRTIETLYKTK